MIGSIRDCCENPLHRVHDIPCGTSHTNITWISPPSKGTSPFRVRAGLSPQRFLPAHRGTLLYVPRILLYKLCFLLEYTECHGPACSPHGAVALRQRGLHRQCSDCRCPVWAKRIPFVSTCISVAMVGIDGTSYRVSSRVLASKAEVNFTPETEFGVFADGRREFTHIKPRGL